jgi:hypothetical protein
MSRENGLPWLNLVIWLCFDCRDLHNACALPRRYEPVSKKLFGVVMLRDQKPGTEEELVQVCAV